MIAWFRKRDTATTMYAFSPILNHAGPLAIVRVRSKQEKPGVLQCDVYPASSVTGGIDLPADRLFQTQLNEDLAEIAINEFVEML